MSLRWSTRPARAPPSSTTECPPTPCPPDTSLRTPPAAQLPPAPRPPPAGTQRAARTRAAVWRLEHGNVRRRAPPRDAGARLLHHVARPVPGALRQVLTILRPHALHRTHRHQRQHATRRRHSRPPHAPLPPPADAHLPRECAGCHWRSGGRSSASLRRERWHVMGSGGLGGDLSQGMHGLWPVAGNGAYSSVMCGLAGKGSVGMDGVRMGG
jgi:hypothetical protein